MINLGEANKLFALALPIQHSEEGRDRFVDTLFDIAFGLYLSFVDPFCELQKRGAIDGLVIEQNKTLLGQALGQDVVIVAPTCISPRIGEVAYRQSSNHDMACKIVEMIERGF